MLQSIKEPMGDETKAALIARLKTQLGLTSCSGSVQIRQRGLKIEQQIFGIWREVKSVYDIHIPSDEDKPINQKLRRLIDCAVHHGETDVAYYRLDVPQIPSMAEKDYLHRVGMLLRVLFDEPTFVRFYTSPRTSRGYVLTFDRYDIDQGVEEVNLPYPEDDIHWTREVL